MRILAVLFSSLFFSGPLFAIYTGSVSAGTGNSGVAAVEPGEAPFSNPAALAYLQGYFFTAAYTGAGDWDSSYALSLTDRMKETVIPMSLGYVKSGQTAVTDQFENLKTQILRLSIGEFVRKSWSVGGGLTYRNHQWMEAAVDQEKSETDFSLAVMWTPKEDFGVALVVDNLVGSREDTPQALRNPAKSTLAAAWNYQKFIRAKFDLVSGPNQTWAEPTYRAGLEYYMNQWTIGRLGHERDEFLNQSRWTAGLGFILPRFGIHYAYQSRLESEDSARHSVDLLIPVW
jgi:hypothetical protein